jgi:hypothetical protein
VKPAVVLCGLLLSSTALATEAMPIPPPDPEPSPFRWRLSAGVNAIGALGLTPDVALVIPVFADLRRDRPGLSTPAFRVAFARIDSGTLTSGAATANLVWTTGRLDACPITFRGAIFGFEPCVRFSAGAIDGSGNNITNAQTVNRPWADLGLVARARATIFDVFFVEVEVSASATLTRDRFLFEPDRTVSQASLFTGGAGLGLGAFFF